MKEVERLERIEEKLDTLFDLIKGKLTTGVYSSDNTERITLPVTTTEEEEKDIENWEREWEITPVYNQVSFIKALLDKAREEGYEKAIKDMMLFSFGWEYDLKTQQYLGKIPFSEEAVNLCTEKGTAERLSILSAKRKALSKLKQE